MCRLGICGGSLIADLHPRRSATLRHDQRPGAMFGEELQQHRVCRFAVQDDDAFDAALDRLDAGLDLGDHATRNGPIGDQRLGLRHRQLVYQLLILVQHAGHVGQEQEARRLHCAGDCARECIGVDVVCVAEGF